jgi:calcium-dependent protein kinase
MGSALFNTICCDQFSNTKPKKIENIRNINGCDDIDLIRTAVRTRSLKSNKGSSEIKSTYQSEDLQDIKSLSALKIKTSYFIFQLKGMPSDYYEKICLIGHGSYGKVYKVIHKSSGDIRAIKVIKIDNLAQGLKVSDIERELRILKMIDHPGVIKVYESYIDSANFYLVTEYYSEGDLYEHVTKMKTMSEQLVKAIMFQIVSAVSFLHSNNIIHGDLKLENIMVDSLLRRPSHGSSKPIYDIKLIDFGCSKIFTKEKRKFHDIVGTLYYASPEVLKNNYSEKCDLWACGVIMYFLLSGRPPFTGFDDQEISECIKIGNFDFNDSVFQKVSPSAKDIILQLLTHNPEKRISAQKALEHEFFSDIRDETVLSPRHQDTKAVLMKLKDFNVKEKFNQAVLTFLTYNFANKEEIVKLQKIFQCLDLNNDGKISRDELKNSYEVLKIQISDTEIDEILRIIDADNSGYIDYAEFIRATIDKDKLLTETHLKIVFDTFDTDKNGKIDSNDLRNMFGKNINDELMSKLLKEVHSEEISFDEFSAIIRSSLS